MLDERTAKAMDIDMNSNCTKPDAEIRKQVQVLDAQIKSLKDIGQPCLEGAIKALEDQIILIAMFHNQGFPMINESATSWKATQVPRITI